MPIRAEVIKVENPKGGDDTRAWGPPYTENKSSDDTGRGESAYFLCVNRNKKSITVDMKSEGGRQLLHDLVKECDVLVENYLPGKLSKMGMGYEQLSKINPKLVYASITGWRIRPIIEEINVCGRENCSSNVMI